MNEQYRAEFTARAYIFNKRLIAIAAQLGTAEVVELANPETPSRGKIKLDGGPVIVEMTWNGTEKMTFDNGARYSYVDPQGQTQFVTEWDLLSFEERYKNVPGPVRRINASATKADAVIARDIRRRLVPGLQEMNERAQAKIEATTAWENDQDATAKRIADALGVTRKDRKPYDFYLPGGAYARVNVTSNKSVRFEAFSVDADTAIAIGKILAKVTKD